ncbi:MAG: DUF2017 family protein [Candidatus Dormiibacterota bacterium]
MAEVRRRRGRIQLRLDSSERAVIGAIVEQLAPHLGKVPRTSPVAYADPELQAEYERWVRPSVESGRNADLDVIRDSVSSGEDVTPLTEAQAMAWTRGLNHLRLAAGGLLGIDEDGWEEQASDQLRSSGEYRVLMALGLLQEELVAALEG